MGLAVSVLGPVLAAVDGDPVALPRPRERTVLAALALAHPAAVPGDVLAATLWPEGGGTAATVRSHVSRLRRAVGADAIRSSPAGYLLDLSPDALHHRRLQQLAVAAGHALRADPAAARDRAREALALWRDEPLPELGDDPAAEAVRADLHARRRAAVGVLGEALLRLGDADGAAAALAPACALAPLDEPLWALLVRALHAAGRRDEARARYDEVRATLARELGMDPGEQLRAARDALAAEPAPADAGGARPRRMRVRYAPNGTRSLCHTVLGDAGPPLLLLHGMFMPFEMLAEDAGAAAFLDRLADRHRLVLMDLGGLGLSDGLPPDALSFEGWADDAAAVLDHLDLGPSPVIGCGPSAAVALHLAARRPDLVARLVLAGVPIHGHWDDTPMEEALDQAANPTGLGEAVRWLAPSRAGDAAFSGWLDRGGERGASPSTALAFFRALFALDLTDVLRATAVPTLVIERPDATSDGGAADEVLGLLPDGHRFTQRGVVDVLPFASGAAAWADAALAFVDGGVAPAGAAHLAAVAASRSPSGTVVVSAHPTPAEAVAAAHARMGKGGAAALDVGLVLPGAPPSGPAVEAAVARLSDVVDGEVVSSPAFAALQGAG